MDNQNPQDRGVAMAVADGPPSNPQVHFQSENGHRRPVGQANSQADLPDSGPHCLVPGL